MKKKKLLVRPPGSRRSFLSARAFSMAENSLKNDVITKLLTSGQNHVVDHMKSLNEEDEAALLEDLKVFVVLQPLFSTPGFLRRVSVIKGTLKLTWKNSAGN